MSKKSKLIYVVMLSALVCGRLLASPKAEPVGKEKQIVAPPAVLAAFNKAYPKAEILNVSKEKKEGKEYFEIESRDSTMRRDLLYLSGGTVYEMEETVTPESLPAKIKDAIKTKYPEGQIQRAERITRGAVTEYEVQLKHQKDKWEILLDASGLIKSTKEIKAESKEAKESEKEEDEDDD